jgi:hypothetical protein
MSKKAQRDEERRREAIRRLRLHTFIAILIPIMDAWEVGLKGGGEKGQMSFKAVDVEAKEARYIKMQMGKIAKARDAVVRMLGVDSFNVGMSFYRTADEKLQTISNAVIKHLPADASRADQLRTITYIIYTAFHDLRILTDDQRPEVKKLISVLGALANHLIDRDSPLVHPMSWAYWETRDTVQEFPDWSRGDEIEWGPSEQDLYERGKAA